MHSLYISYTLSFIGYCHIFKAILEIVSLVNMHIQSVRQNKSTKPWSLLATKPGADTRNTIQDCKI